MLWKPDMKPLTSVVWERRTAWRTNCGTPSSVRCWRDGWPLCLAFWKERFREQVSHKGIVGIVFLWLRTEHHFSKSRLLSRGKKRKNISWRLWVSPCLSMSSPWCSESSAPEMKAKLRRAKTCSCSKQDNTALSNSEICKNENTWQFNLFHCKNWSILRVNKMNNLSSTVRTSTDTRCLTLTNTWYSAWPHRIFSAMAFCRGWLRKAKHRSSTASSAAKVPKSRHRRWS